MTNEIKSRISGVLLHITSLPSAYGIGGLGKEAFAFVDYLQSTHQTYWQILPLNYPGYGDSPYNSISSFAGNPWLIDPNKLFEAGLVSSQDLHKAELPNDGKVHFPVMMKTKQKLFKTAFNNFKTTNDPSLLNDFLEKEGYWLKPFSVFCHLRNIYEELVWQKWSAEQRFYSDSLFDEIYQQNPDDILYHVFLQYVFDKQLAVLKTYAVEQGIQIIGDLPLYVSLNSSDVWSNPELFELDSEGYPHRVAGVPPDAFSETGQLWGNPLYRWDKMQEQDFDWWKKRLGKALVFADRIRIDHFIGLVNFWAVDAHETSAINGNWIPGPKYAFFDSILQVFPKEAFIAEDLGILTDEVNHLREHYGFPGMIILQFCFQDDQNDILSFPENKIIFTGTHDNHTTLGWFLANQEADKSDNHHMENYLHKVGMLADDTKLTKHNVSELMTDLAYKSPCHIAIVPMQDILSLDDNARMNVPGTAIGNWHWRMTSY